MALWMQWLRPWEPIYNPSTRNGSIYQDLGWPEWGWQKQLGKTSPSALTYFDSFTWGLWGPQENAQFLGFKHMDTSTRTGRKGEGEATWVSLHGGNARHLRKAPSRGKEPEVWTRPSSRPQNPREVMVLAEAGGRYLNASISAQGYILMKGWGDAEKPYTLWWS